MWPAFSPEDILQRVKKGPKEGNPLKRPSVLNLVEKPFGKNKNLLNLMKKCWAEQKDDRPTFKSMKIGFPNITKQK